MINFIKDCFFNDVNLYYYGMLIFESLIFNFSN